MPFMYWFPLAIGIGGLLGAFFVWVFGWNRDVRGPGRQRGLVQHDRRLHWSDRLQRKLDEYEHEQRDERDHRDGRGPEL